MKRYLIIIYILIIPTFLFSQGFDWQYSSRLPFDSPRFFVGPIVNFDYLYHIGNIQLDENECKECANFKKGYGFAYNFGLNAEYWINGYSAISSHLSYYSNSADFTARGPVYPLNDSVNLITENEYKASINYLQLGFDYKYRIYDSHFSFGSGIDFNIKINESNEHFEKVISPKDFYFKTNPPSQTREISNYRTSELRSFLITPKISTGYDMDLGLGFYSNIKFSIGIPLIDMNSTSDWSKWSFGLSITAFKGILLP